MRKKLDKFTGTDEFHWKIDCFDGSIVSSFIQPTLFSFALEESPGYKQINVQKLYNIKSKSIISHWGNFLRLIRKTDFLQW